MTVVPMGRSVVRPDIFASLTLAVAGIAGLLALVLPWYPADRKLAGSESLTGWTLFVLGRGQQLSTTQEIALYAIIVVGCGGGALVLLAVTMLTPIDHQPLGLVALLVSLGAIGSAAWWLATAVKSFGSIDAFLSAAQPGWWCFALAGLVGLTGSIKAMISR